MFKTKKKLIEQSQAPMIVAECQCVNDAEFTKSILDSYCIESMIIDSSAGESLRYNAAMITRKGFVKVLVKRPDYETAKKILSGTSNEAENLE